MIVKWLNKALSLFHGKNDRFLVLEIYESRNRVTYLKADLVNKEIKVIKSSENCDLRKVLRRFGRLSGYKIIVGLDSHLATTVYSSVVLVRDNFKDLIDEPEIDNLVSQAIWKFFDRQRAKVASKMGVTDLDLILADVKIRGVKLDGHKIVNPAGFKAKTVEIQFSQTFLLRDSVNTLKEFLPMGQVIFMTENGTAWSNVVAKSGRETEFLLANIYSGKTHLFFSNGSHQSYLDRFHWGEESLNNSLARDLAVEPETAKLIINRYLQNQASETFRRRLEHLLAKELAVLASSLNYAVKKSEARAVFLNPFFDLPNVLTPAFKNNFDHSVPLFLLGTDFIGQAFGFDIKFKNKSEEKPSFGSLALLIEWYLAPQDDRMSQLAKRRVRWLSPN